ncbi:hypothetical protein CMI47_00180 [Candidatus Pacearchaeota archaeon]|nr:hypothetical protein [Candidatus Pacearchaeota archaeon]|tara:strand:+ start:22773 stop:24020 length:1248 start_codon:yes stop_codon:yes gene_type:complete
MKISNSHFAESMNKLNQMGMKLIVFVLAMLLMPSVFAISVDLAEVYQSKETVILEISGNILEGIKEEQVDFKRGHVSVPLEFDIKKIGDKNYLWFIAPENENDYTLVLEDIVTTVSGQVTSVDFEQNFSVLNGSVDYNINPGFVVTSDDFSLDLFLYEDFDKEIESDFGLILLKPGENEVDFKIGDFALGVGTLSVGKYALPINILGEGRVVLPDFRFKPRILESVVLTGAREVYPFFLINSGRNAIDNIEFEYNQDVFLIEPSGISIEPDSQGEFNLSLVKEIEDELDEVIYARSGDFESELRVVISLGETEEDIVTPYLEEDYVESELFYCSELSGVICSAGETCDGEVVSSYEGACCVGSCSVPDDGGSYRWIGWVIGIVVLLIVIYVVYRYKKKKPGKDQLGKRVKEIEKK